MIKIAGKERRRYYLSVNIQNEEQLKRFMETKLVEEYYYGISYHIIELQIRNDMPCWVYCLSFDDADEFWNDAIRQDLLDTCLPVAITQDSDYYRSKDRNLWTYKKEGKP